MPIQLTKDNWTIYNDPGVHRVANPVDSSGEFSLEVPVGLVGGNPFTMLLENYASLANTASQSSRLLMRPQFAGTTGIIYASIALRANSISAEGIPDNVIYAEISWDRATATRSVRVVRGTGGNASQLGDAVAIPAGAIDDAIDVSLHINDVNSADVHVQVNAGSTVLINALDVSSPLYGQRGVWGASFFVDGSGEVGDTLLIDSFMGSTTAPSEALPSEEPDWVGWFDDFSPNVSLMVAPDVGGGYVHEPGAEASYYTDNGELVGNNATVKYLASQISGDIPAGGYRIGFKVGRKGAENVFQQFGFCYDQLTGVSYTIICFASSWMVVKMAMVDNVLTPQNLTASNTEWRRDTGTPVDIIVKPGIGFDLYIDGTLAQAYSDTELFMHTGLYFGLGLDNGVKALVVTDDLTVQQGFSETVWLYTDWTPDTVAGLPAPSIGNAWMPFSGDLSDFSTSEGKAVASSGGPPALNDSLPLEQVPPGGYRIYGKAGPGTYRGVYPCVELATLNGYQFIMRSDLGLQLFKMLAGVPETPPLAENSTIAALDGCPWDIIVKPAVGLDIYVNGVLELTTTDSSLIAASSVVGWNGGGSSGLAAPFAITNDLTPQATIAGMTGATSGGGGGGGSAGEAPLITHYGAAFDYEGAIQLVRFDAPSWAMDGNNVVIHVETSPTEAGLTGSSYSSSTFFTGQYNIENTFYDFAPGETRWVRLRAYNSGAGGAGDWTSPIMLTRMTAVTCAVLGTNVHLQWDPVDDGNGNVANNYDVVVSDNPFSDLTEPSIVYHSQVISPYSFDIGSGVTKFVRVYPNMNNGNYYWGGSMGPLKTAQTPEQPVSINLIRQVVGDGSGTGADLKVYFTPNTVNEFGYGLYADDTSSVISEGAGGVLGVDYGFSASIANEEIVDGVLPINTPLWAVINGVDSALDSAKWGPFILSDQTPAATDDMYVLARWQNAGDGFLQFDWDSAILGTNVTVYVGFDGGAGAGVSPSNYDYAGALSWVPDNGHYVNVGAYTGNVWIVMTGNLADHLTPIASSIPA